ncbi:glycoside hydrolase 43 family protein [Leadbetterella sp. DM7]|uniref:glycoside hydrolase family 43 protein n=1 Tax=Leadbetterella sp. DM7 TaxID=3235085 RepID=UPI00349E9CED
MIFKKLLVLLLVSLWGIPRLCGQARNPVIFADVPDPSMIRVGDTYYMSSTTMHMNPGVPVMKSRDLVNWEIINYAYGILEEGERLNLENGKNMYSNGTWASSLRYHKGTYYLSTFSNNTGKTYIFTTKDIEKGDWKMVSFRPAFHDHTLFFDAADRAYLIYGGGRLRMVELNDDLSGVREGTKEKVVIENATAPIGNNFILNAEGSQLFQHNGKYYMFNIAWPRGGMRTVIIHRADRIEGPWEGRVALQDQGVAQGGLIDTPDGRWFSYLFRDYGAVGRIPYLVPVEWKDGWPVLGINGKVPETLALPAGKGLIPGIVASDEFRRKKKSADLPLVWQWNHNPDNRLWSVRERKGYLRLKTGRTDGSVVEARNTLTQRTTGPKSTGETALELSGMQDGDRAGLVALQSDYGWVGVKAENGRKILVMVNAPEGRPVEQEAVELKQDKVFLRIACDFTDMKDEALFCYSLDGRNWTPIGNTLKMKYKLTHFMGYRFGLFNYATKQAGGYADFDWFRISQP